MSNTARTGTTPVATLQSILYEAGRERAGVTIAHGFSYDIGFTAGYSTGFAAGTTAGYATGFSAGYSAGFIAGEAAVAIGGSAQSVVFNPPERWTPLVAVLNVLGGLLIVFYRSGTNRFTIYDPTATPGHEFSELFGERSSVIKAGPIWTVTLLPNGGWWQESFEIKYFAGVEMT